MHMIMLMSYMHGIVVLSTWYDDMHGMSLRNGVLRYMHNLGLDYYMKKVLLSMYEIVFTFLVDV